MSVNARRTLIIEAQPMTSAVTDARTVPDGKGPAAHGRAQHGRGADPLPIGIRPRVGGLLIAEKDGGGLVAQVQPLSQFALHNSSSPRMM